jgi:hypothetical protein
MAQDNSRPNFSPEKHRPFNPGGDCLGTTAQFSRREKMTRSDMKTFAITMALSIGLLLAISVTFAHATTILQDDFNRADSNTVNNGWVEVESAALDAEISANELSLTNFASITHSVTLGANSFYDLWLEFDYLTGTDIVIASLSTDNVIFTQLASFTGTGAAQIFTTLASGFNTAWIRLASGSGGAAGVDNFSASAPEPSTLLIMGMGLLAMGGLGPLMNRRRRMHT